MSNENIKEHLRAALSEVVTKDKDRTESIFDDSDERSKQQFKKMAPLLEAISLLSEEVGTIGGLRVSVADHGHMATVEAKDSTSSCRLSISTNYDNEKFEVEESRFYSFSSDYSQNTHLFDTAEEVMELVLDVTGKHIASGEVRSNLRKWLRFSRR